MGDLFEKRVLIARSRVDGRRNRRFTRIANRNFHATSCFADAPSNSGGWCHGGLTFNHIFLTDSANYATMNKVYPEFFPGDRPARLCINSARTLREITWRSTPW
jgi:hypothetical protein